VTLGRMDSLLQQATPTIAQNFVRIGRHFIVNLKYIHLINILKQELVLSDCIHFTFKLHCSKEALKHVRELLQNTHEKCFLIDCANNSSAKPTISDNI
jgi:DNA-binding LytR/AlgR family response regulator